MRLIPLGLGFTAVLIGAAIFAPDGASAQATKTNPAPAKPSPAKKTPAPAKKAPVPAKKPVATAPKPVDWNTRVGQTSAGAYVIGNPTAKVHLVEYLSYSCGHCAHFVAESKAPLKQDLVRRGQVRVEMRHAIRDPLDLTAALLARCAGPTGFAGASEAIFARQQSWYQRGAQFWQANQADLQPQPEIDRLKAIAHGSGLAELMKGRGMTPARINQCFATSDDLDRLTAMADAAWKVIKGTPTFEVNGTVGGGGHWETLAPVIRAAGAR